MNEELAAFYEAVDRGASRLSMHHAERLRCARGCASCCVDGITVFEIEAANIRSRNPELIASGEPGPKGACAFLDSEGACRIYSDRPYVCRTQGLPLRWLEETVSGTVEYRDICPLNEEGDPVEDLEPDECWTIGEYEGRLVSLQAKFFDDRMDRTPLRELFLKHSN